MLIRLTALAVAIDACCFLNCSIKAPTPVISGPDSGWTRAPLVFRARPVPHGAIWSWGDSDEGDSYLVDGGEAHAWPRPGVYSVTCTALPRRMEQNLLWFLISDVPSEPSEPCTTRIIEDTLVFPDTVVATIPIGQRGKDWACILPGGDRLYVTDAAHDSVTAINTSTNSVTAAVAVPDSPTCCVASSSGQFVYVSSVSARTVTVISTQGDSVVRTIPISGQPGRLAILPNDSFLYIAHSDSSLVSVIRTSDDSCSSSSAPYRVPWPLSRTANTSMSPQKSATACRL